MHAKVERIQAFIQATNAAERFDERRTMMEALLERELARKQVCSSGPPALVAQLYSCPPAGTVAHMSCVALCSWCAGPDAQCCARAQPC